MPEQKLGSKWECFSCGTKFYDLGKPTPLCPKCGANQNDAGPATQVAASSAAKRKRKTEVVRPLEDDIEVPIEDAIPDEDLVGELEGADLDDDEVEEDFDDDEE